MGGSGHVHTKFKPLAVATVLAASIRGGVARGETLADRAQAHQMRPATSSNVFGSVVDNWVITVKPGLPSSGYPINGMASIAPTADTSFYVRDEKTVVAAHSGSTASCSATIYST